MKIKFPHIITIIISLATITWTYSSYAKYAGLFPAESIRSSTEKYEEIKCNKKNITTTSDLRDLPHLELDSTEAEEQYRAALFKARSIGYSTEERIIYAVDAIDEADLITLKKITRKNQIPQAALEKFINQAANFYAPCPYSLSFEKEITSGYWASTEAAKIHHWAHLYAGATSLDGKSQYGYLIPNLANLLSNHSDSPGPSHFTSSAWWIFMACGLLYALMIHRLAACHGEKSGLIATSAIIFKTAGFYTITPYMMLMAPGFHWFRELITLAIGIITFIPSKKYRLAAITTTFPILYFTDPTYFLIGLSAATITVVIKHKGMLQNWIKNADRKKILLISGICLTGTVALGLGASENIHYVFKNIANIDITLIFTARHLGFTWMYALILLLPCALAIKTITSQEKSEPIEHYFAFVMIIGLTYFATHPGQPHFIKCLEYGIPLFVIYSTKIIKKNHQKYAIITLAACTLTFLTPAFGFIPYKNEKTLSPYSDISKFRTVTIFGRTGNLNINQETEKHLINFPHDVKHDFIISPYDKHLLMFGSFKNGWKNVDWTLSGQTYRPEETMATIQEASLKKEREIKIIIDSTTLSIDMTSGIKKWATDFYAVETTLPRLGLKHRIQAFETSQLILRMCPRAERLNETWLMVSCSAHSPFENQGL